MTAELSLPCFSCSLLVLHMPDGTIWAYSLPSHTSGGTGVPDLHTEPGQTCCCWIPRICLAMQARDTLPIFARAAVSQEADSFPLCQSSRAQAEDGSKRLFMAASILSQGTLRCSCFFLEAKFSPFLHIPKQQDYFCLLVPLTPVSER